MKTFNTMLLICTLLSIGKWATAQTLPNGTGGLYLTSVDFTHQKLTYTMNSNRHGDKIKLNSTFGSDKGVILANGEKHVFDKRDTYGYKSCKNKNYRFYHNDVYQILDTQGFFLYYTYRTEFIIKGATRKEEEYFFSSKPNGQLIPLTKENLENAYVSNTKFRYELEAMNNTEKNLAAYDPYLRIHKVNYLYYDSVK